MPASKLASSRQNVCPVSDSKADAGRVAIRISGPKLSQCATSRAVIAISSLIPRKAS